MPCRNSVARRSAAWTAWTAWAARRAGAARGAWLCAVILALFAAAASAGAVAEDAPGPFEKFAGRWVGEGRLGFREAATEQVKCRVTYITSGAGNTLDQSIRCAAQGASIDVRTHVSHADGKLSGTWKEMGRDWSGTVNGSASDTSLKLRVAGEHFNANMAVQLRSEKQVIEIQFIDSTLIGLTLLLTKG